ncbi:MAG: NAD(+) synthase [Prevotella sp.]|nr:NAD(+) synthase [Prevotella sp.]
MRNFGYLKVGSAVPPVRVADVEFNVEQIKKMINKAVAKGVEILCFPEMCITGYTCQDLFHNAALLDAAETAVDDLADYCEDLPIVVIVGAPLRQGDTLGNVAAVIAGGKNYFVNKTFYPNYGEFYEKRWFNDGYIASEPTVFLMPSGEKFMVEICEDLWSPVPPSSRAAGTGVDIIFNLSASNELIGKHQYLQSLIAQQSARCIAGYVYSSAGFGESTQDVVYGGNAIIYENGVCLAASERFSIEEQLVTAQIDVERLQTERRKNTTFGSVNADEEDVNYIELDVEQPDDKFRLERPYDPHPFIPKTEDMAASCNEIFSIQVMGLVKRLVHTRCENVVIGISGGLDSTLALLVATAAFDKLKLDRKGIHGITMPGFGTSSRTHDNAVKLMKSLNISCREIPIAAAVEQHFKDIGHDAAKHDVTYENSQARYRTMLLMDIANQTNGLVIGTGDLSEAALGWCTYNGDHMSMYAVNIGVPKTLVRYLVRYFAENEANAETKKTLLDIIDTPVSPELLPDSQQREPGQRTEDILGPYELHDFFLYHFLRFGFAPEKLLLLAMRAFDGINGPMYRAEEIKKCLALFLRRFFAQQFKRSCMPDGPKVGSVSLSPRGDWRMPSDAAVKLWLDKV